ncbi:MAG: flagellar hook-basal body complex protein FliE [Defluviitaleaceae bacterium]|nr:flagellar hook-basal body complex protein FliE [Defluviitaleaceae bacterium]
MSIEGLSQLGFERVQGQSIVDTVRRSRASEAATTGEEFDGVLQAAMDLFNETSRLEHEAHSVQLDYITGRTDDILAVVLAEQRAQMAVNFTVQITSRIVEAYRQIISMQI